MQNRVEVLAERLRTHDSGEPLSVRQHLTSLYRYPNMGGYLSQAPCHYRSCTKLSFPV